MVVNEAFHALFHEWDIEVQEKPDRPSAESQVREELRFVDRQQGVDRLDFNDNTVFDYEIQAVSTLQILALVLEGDVHLPTKIQAPQFQFPGQTGLVCRFKKSGSEQPMDLNGRTKNLFRYEIDVQILLRALCASAVNF